jgi:urease accessory protein UreF
LQSFYSACGAAREDDDDDDESETFAMLEHFRALGLEIPPEIAEALRDERATAAAAAAAATAAFASSRKPAMTLCALLRAWATELHVRERLGVEVMPYTEDDDVECVREASAIVERAMKR